MTLTQENQKAVDRVMDLAKAHSPIHFDLLSATGLGTRGLGKLLNFLKKRGYCEGGGRRYLEIVHANS